MSRLIVTKQAVTPATPATSLLAIFGENLPGVGARLKTVDETGIVSIIGPVPMANAITSVAGVYAVDTYLAGSAITILTGQWKAQTQYKCVFDMTKTAAGVASFTVTVRLGTLGTTGDAAILVLTFAAGTAAVDTGKFELLLTFRTVGSGTTAVVQAMLMCSHNLAATGLVSTGAAGVGVIVGTSAGFASNTATIIGISINGGASFAGTTTIVQTELLGI